MGNPLVSIIIPTYSRPKNLVRAIESVLTQTYDNIEIIIVDDNGIGTKHQKETEKVLESYLLSNKVVYLKHDVNKNGSAARNTGVNAAHGEIIGLLDDDDEFLANKIEEQVLCLEKAHQQNIKVCGCFCNGLIVTKTHRHAVINHVKGNLAEQLLLGEVRFNSSTIIVYKESYIKIGGFDERYKRHQDWEFFLRFLGKYDFVQACPDTWLNIKHSTPNVLTKNMFKSIEYKEFFLKNFEKEILNMPQASAIYHYQYILLVYSLIRGRFLKEAWKYFQKSNSYQVVSLKEYLKIIESLILSFLK